MTPEDQEFEEITEGLRGPSVAAWGVIGILMAVLVAYVAAVFAVML